MKKKSHKIYETPCYGHNCERYKYADDLLKEINQIYQDWNSAKNRAFPFFKLLRQLAILPSTPEHWKKCRPLNLKLLEGVKPFCDETLFDFISDDKRLVMEYIKLTKPKIEIKEEEQEQDKIPIDFLTASNDKKDK